MRKPFVEITVVSANPPQGDTTLVRFYITGKTDFKLLFTIMRDAVDAPARAGVQMRMKSSKHELLVPVVPAGDALYSFYLDFLVKQEQNAVEWMLLPLQGGKALARRMARPIR
jgi:hypothetical protein